MFSGNVVLEEIVSGLRPSRPVNTESFFNTWWEARGEMCALKDFCWLEMCLISRIDCFLNRLLSYMSVSRNIVEMSEN